MDFITDLMPIPRMADFLLVMLRVSALIISSPLFGRTTLPRTIKVGFCLALSYMFFVAYPQSVNFSGITLLGYAALCAKEMLFGLILAFCTNLYFTLTFTAGHIIDMQVGFGMVNVLDPQSNLQVPLTGNLLNLVLLMCFFAVNGHHKLFTLVGSSLLLVPAGQVGVSATLLARAAVEAFAQAFLLGVQVAMPVIAGAMVLEAVLGVMIRTVPQLNMYVAGLPIKIILGLMLIMLLMQPYVQVSNAIFDHMFKSVEWMLEGLVPA